MEIITTSEEGIDIFDCSVPIVFENMKFRKSAGTFFFRVRNATVKFINCAFVGVSGQKLFNLFHEDAKVELDAATVAATTGTWTSMADKVSDYGYGHHIKVINATAAPTTGIFRSGIRAHVAYPGAGPTEYICTADGSPGTWRGIGAV